MTDEQLNDFAEKLLTAHRCYLEAQRAYYGRTAVVDTELEEAVVDTSEAYNRAQHLYMQALTVWSPHSDQRYIHFAVQALAREGLT